MPWTGLRLRAWAIGVAALIILGIMAWPLFTGRVYASDDLGWFHFPLRAFYARCLAAGDDPSWCPNLYCGFYLQGEGQVGLCHPAHLLLYRLLPLAMAFDLELLIGYPLAFLGLYLVLCSHRLRSDAAMLGALVFTFAGYQLLHYRHVNSVAILAHLPWSLLAIRHALHDPPKRAAGWRLTLGLLTSSQLLIGHPQTVWTCAIAEVGYTIGLTWTSRCGPARVLWLAIAMGLGVLGGAIQWIPTLQAVRESARQTVTPESASLGSLHPLNLLVPVAPYLFAARVYGPEIAGGPGGVASNLQDWRTHEYGMYLGAVVPVLLGWLVLRWKHMVQGKLLSRAALIVAFPALLLAFGKYTPVYEQMRQLPLVGSFRVPARYLLLVQLAEAVLAAVAFADLCRVSERGEEPPARLAWLWFFPVLALAAVFVAQPLIRIGDPTALEAPLSSRSQLALGVGLVLAATALVLLAAHGRRRALLAIVLLLAADVGYYGMSYMRDHSVRPIDSYVSAEALPSGPADVRIRQLGERDNALAGCGLWLADGYAALAPRRVLPDGHPISLRLAGVGWLTSGRKGALVWTPVPDPLPRVRLVAGTVAPSDAASVLDTIDPETTAILEPGHEVDLPPGPIGEVRGVTERPGKIDIVTSAPETRLLVISESYHEGWHARVDGGPVETLRVNGDFLGCYVPAGVHGVSLAFAPASLARGRAVSIASLLVLLGWTIAVLAKPEIGPAAPRGPHFRGAARERAPSATAF
jgi:hypothetical protein